MRIARVVAVVATTAFAAGLSPQETAPSVTWAAVLQQEAAWYGTTQARAIAEIVLSYQQPDGGWPKNIDMTVAPTPKNAPERQSTIDNGATTTQLHLLARLAAATHEARYREAALRGMDYLLAAQYPNGGWPQVWPLKKDYSRHITFNDDAMVRVLRLLDDVATGRESWTFVDAARHQRAAKAIEKGVDVILRSQIRVAGALTAWCAQHDEVTLAPRQARAYEHPSLSGQETVGIVRFLMSRPQPDIRIVSAIESAVTWLRSAALHGWRVERRPDASKPSGWDRVMVRDPDAPPLWARFYEIGTNRPIFSGRDGVIRYNLADIEHERRTGYAWIGDWPRVLLETDYPAWKARLH
jgi:PelA/Pel-15E family pectate lyase